MDSTPKGFEWSFADFFGVNSTKLLNKELSGQWL